MVDRSTRVTVLNNDISGNETGIQISYLGSGIVVKGNRIHDNNRMIINDSAPYNDRGANAITFFKTTGWITVTGNTIFGHRASSHDYGYDGGAFEIYASSNLNLTGNTLYNNQNVLETGTDGSTGCANIKFTRNIAYGGADGGRPSQGLVLRCMSQSLVANNTFDDLTDFVYYVTQSGGFVGSIEGLTIRNNVSRQPSSKTYSFQGVPAGLTIDRNLTWNSAGTSIAWVNGKGNTDSLATFRSWTGYDAAGIQANPGFSDTSFHLLSTSPAIDHGSVISGITDGFLRAAPDLGRRETR